MSYHNKGTIMTLRNLVRHRGFSGMYTGLNLHLRKLLLGCLAADPSWQS